MVIVDHCRQSKNWDEEMVSKMARLAATVALVATLNGAAAEQSLRESMFDALRAERGGVPRHCRKLTGHHSIKDRWCEPEFKPSSRCGCKEVCHIFGDPHVAPFFSRCSTKSMLTDGPKALFVVPDGGRNRPGVNISGTVEHSFVTQLFVNGRKELDVSQCIDGTKMYHEDEFELVGEQDENAIVRIGSYCEPTRARAQRRLGAGPYHLNSTVTVIDSFDSNVQALGEALSRSRSAKLERREARKAGASIVPGSVRVFSNAYGTCVNPCNDAAADLPNAHRVLTIPEGGCPARNDAEMYFFETSDAEDVDCHRAVDGIDGRECSCGAQCAVYGDPYLVDLYSSMSHRDKPGCKRDDFRAERCFEVFQTEDPQSTELYVLEAKDGNNGYQAKYELDECNFIVRMIFNYFLADGTFWQQIYDADQECTEDAHFDPDTRKRIVAPAKVDPYERKLEDKSDETKQQRWNDRVNVGVYDSTVMGFKLSGDGVTDQSVGVQSSGIDPGGVRAILKCHKRTDEKAYFNVCLERTGVTDSSPDTSAASSLTMNMAGVEAMLQSRGACALGAPQRNGSFKYRSAGAFTAAAIPAPGQEPDKPPRLPKIEDEDEEDEEDDSKGKDKDKGEKKTDK